MVLVVKMKARDKDMRSSVLLHTNMADPNDPKTLQVLKSWLGNDLKVKVAGERIPILWTNLL